MNAITEVTVLENYRLRLRFADGTTGTVDLPDLVGKGVFQRWEDYDFFGSVAIGVCGELRWGEDIDLCADALYLRATGKEPQDIFPSLRKDRAHA
ncbi:MAG: DUF2442 domain-containing protein [Planctomycetaceae bacterium]|nr:DUF2442 domain-containing protein [Planctomycetaceae bacterium]